MDIVKNIKKHTLTVKPDGWLLSFRYFGEPVTIPIRTGGPKFVSYLDANYFQGHYDLYFELINPEDDHYFNTDGNTTYTIYLQRYLKNELIESHRLLNCFIDSVTTTGYELSHDNRILNRPTTSVVIKSPFKRTIY